jgi:hypothetical protein
VNLCTGNSTNTAFATILRLVVTLTSESSSALRFRVFLVTGVEAGMLFVVTLATCSTSDVSGVSGSTEFSLLRKGDTVVLVAVVVAGVLAPRPEFLVCTMATGGGENAWTTRVVDPEI